MKSFLRPGGSWGEGQASGLPPPGHNLEEGTRRMICKLRERRTEKQKGLVPQSLFRILRAEDHADGRHHLGTTIAQ